MQGPKTSPKTEKTATSSDKMAMMGNDGNTKATTLPNYGKPTNTKMKKGGGYSKMKY